jgi:hypothetical protein
MLLDDACHSIDSPNMVAILENVKFPNSFTRAFADLALAYRGIAQQGAPL